MTWRAGTWRTGTWRLGTWRGDAATVVNTPGFLALPVQFRGVESEAAKRARRLAYGIVRRERAIDADQADREALEAARYVAQLQAQIAASRAQAQQYREQIQALRNAEQAQARADAIGRQMADERALQKARQGAEAMLRIAIKAQEDAERALLELDMAFVSVVLAEA